MQKKFFSNLHALALVTALLVCAPAMAADLTPKDYTEIQQLYGRYNTAIDSGDAEAWASTFTADGVFNTYKGHDALVGFIKTWRTTLNGAQRRHMSTDIVLTATPEGAKGTVSLLLLDLSTNPASISSSGVYADTLVKTAGGWLFKTRNVKIDTPAPAPKTASAR